MISKANESNVLDRAAGIINRELDIFDSTSMELETYDSLRSAMNTVNHGLGIARTRPLKIQGEFKDAVKRCVDSILEYFTARQIFENFGSESVTSRVIPMLKTAKYFASKINLNIWKKLREILLAEAVYYHSLQDILTMNEIISLAQRIASVLGVRINVLVAQLRDTIYSPNFREVGSSILEDLGCLEEVAVEV